MGPRYILLPSLHLFIPCPFFHFSSSSSLRFSICVGKAVFGKNLFFAGFVYFVEYLYVSPCASICVLMHERGEESVRCWSCEAFCCLILPLCVQINGAQWFLLLAEQSLYVSRTATRLTLTLLLALCNGGYTSRTVSMNTEAAQSVDGIASVCR